MLWASLAWSRTQELSAGPGELAAPRGAQRSLAFAAWRALELPLGLVKTLFCSYRKEVLKTEMGP